MWSSAAAAIAVVALHPRPAQAQAFVGTPTTATGTVTYDRATPSVETITVNSPTATINWTPTGTVTTDGTIIFLPAGNTATFTNGGSVSDFTVLNRISAGVPIEFNGHVISQLQSASGTATGGHVWFYNPGGIIVGATAVFDVGGLLLTTNDPLTFSTTAAGFAGNFVASSNSTASVRIDPGAQINALPENSYVALVAPRVEQNGTVRVNGSAAYVGGEDVTLTMNQGLFDIAVNVGTSDPFNPDSGNGVVHTGTTTGPSSTGAPGDSHRIYMVAVPKNQALTMLLSGNVGFQPASSINIRNGTIVLSAGSSIAETSGTLNIISPPNINADLVIGRGSYSSDVKGYARGDIDVTADDGSMGFRQNLFLTSLLAGETGTITLGASNGFNLIVDRSVVLQTSGATFSSGAPEELNLLVDGGFVRISGNLQMTAGAAADGTPGDIEISVRDVGANEGSLIVDGQTFLATSADASSILSGDSLDSQAGDVTVEALNGGSILFQSSLDIFASASGQDNDGNGSGFNLGRAGDGRGGDITINADTGGSITVNWWLHADATGIGGRMLDGGLFGGNGFGGSVDMHVGDGSSIHVIQDLSLRANGIGGRFIGDGIPASAQGGSGFGGQVTMWSSGTGTDPGSITLDDFAELTADGTGGSGQTGGFGRGGSAQIYAYDGLIALGTDTTVSAVGRGGNASAGFGGSGGAGQGGTALIEARAVAPGFESFPTQGTITGGNATIDSSGFGGSGGAGNGDNILAGVGGEGRAGRAAPQFEQFGGSFANAMQSGGSLTLADVSLVSNGFGGAGGAGGNGQAGGAGGAGFGGTVDAGISLDFYAPDATLGAAHFDAVTGFATGTGGDGGSGPAGQGDGGSGTGGTASLWANSTVTASSLAFFANANGGNGSVGGNAVGGTSTLQLVTGGLLDIDGDLTIEAAAASGNASFGATGNALGGTAELLAEGGSVTIGGAAFLSADGDAEDGVGSGTGTGGTANVQANSGGSIAAGSITAQANGEGGNGTALAGSGFGGTAKILAHAGSSISTGNLTSSATGLGGNGPNGALGLGGDAQAGAVELDGSLTATGLVTVNASGTGGTGSATGTGGDGYGGSAALYAGVGDTSGGGATVTINNAQMLANGTGGAGGTGGTGYGGGDPAETGGIQIGARMGTLTINGSLNALAEGIGGASSNGVGGQGLGGNILVGANFAGDVGTGTVNLGHTDLWAVGIGGNGGGSGNAGGAGFGGLVQVLSPTADSRLNATALSLHAGANGGVGGNGATGGAGGDATGGHALIDIGAGIANLGDTQSFARGVAGNGGTGSSGAGGAGGDGFAGLVELNVSASLTGTSYQGHAQANGGTGGAGTTQGAGGSAQGGSAYFNVFSGGDAALTGAVSLDASAIRGTGSSLGDALGGLAELFVADSFSAGAFTAVSNGSDAGTVHVIVEDGGLADLGVAQLTANGSNGGSILIDIGGVPLVLTDGIGTLALDNTALTADSLAVNTSGDATITSHNGASIDVAGIFSANVTGDMSLDDVDGTAVVRADVIDFNANSFTSTFDILGRMIDISTILGLDVTTTLLDADETLNLSAGGDLTAGDLDAGLAINLNAGNDINAGDLTSGGTIDVFANNNVTLGDLTAVGQADLDAGSNILGNLVFGDAHVGVLDFSADGTVTGGNIIATNKATGDAGGAIVLGDITVGPGLPSDSSDFSVGIGSETSIRVGNVQGVDRVGFATLGDLTTGNITAGSLFMALVSGDVTIGSVTTAADGRVYMADASMFIAAGGGGNDETDDFDVSQVLGAAPVPTGGSITINGPVSTGRFQAAAGVDFESAAITAGQSIEIGAGNDIATGDLNAGTTAGLQSGNDLSVANVTAGTSATFTADGLASFFGTVSAPTITVTSWDIDIAGQLGVSGVTNLVTLNAVSADTPILIGGEESDLVAAAAEGLQYWLSDDEEIEGNTIIFNAVAGGEGPTPDVLVSDFEIEGTGTPGGGVHHAQLNTDGSVKIDGTLVYTSAGADDLLDINAADIQVNTTEGGRIAMVNSAEDAPAGLLELNADNIWVGDQALLDNLNSDVNFVGRDAMVGTNAGSVVPEGWLIAGGMTLGIGNTLFVQNSGAANDFAGITVGDGGLTIQTTGQAAAQVVAYGRKFNADGTFTTGNAFFNLVDFGVGEGSLYTDLSEFNECLINSGCQLGQGSGGPGPEDILGPIDLMGDPQETTEGGTGDDDDDAAGGRGSAARDELIDAGSLTEDQLIDEGVTSGGDNNQWDEQACSDDKADQRCPKKEP